MTHETYLYCIFCLAGAFNKAPRHKQQREHSILTYWSWHPCQVLKKPHTTIMENNWGMFNARTHCPDQWRDLFRCIICWIITSGFVLQEENKRCERLMRIVPFICKDCNSRGNWFSHACSPFRPGWGLRACHISEPALTFYFKVTKDLSQKTFVDHKPSGRATPTFREIALQ